MEETKGTMMVVVEQEQQAAEVNVGDVQLISRLVVGLLLFGVDELLLRLRSAQQRIEASGEPAAGDVLPGDETMAEMLGYLAIGTLMRGQKRLSRTIKRGIGFSLNAVGWAAGTVNRVTDNRLARPFRQPIERRVRRLRGEGQAAIDDGRREVVASRMLTDETMTDLIDEVIQTLAQNPELTSAIERVLVGQGSSLTGTVMDNARQLGVSADDLAEGIVRQILRRKPRRELPPSPLAGKPLTMYEPHKPAQGGQDDAS